MTLNNYEVLLEKMLSGETLTPEEENDIREYESSDPALREMRMSLQDPASEMEKDLLSLDLNVPPLPEGFHQAWASRLKETAAAPKEANGMKKFFSKRNLSLLSAAAVVIFVIGGTVLTRDSLSSRVEKNAARSAPVPQPAETSLYVPAVGGSADYGYSSMATAMTEDAAKMEEPEYEEDVAMEDALVNSTAAYSAASSDTAAGAAETSKKIIRNGNLSIRTQRFDDALSSLQSLCLSMGGWISYSSSYEGYNGLRHATLTLRIPSDSFDAFMQESGSTGKVLRREETAQDVTASYRDTQTRLETQRALMQRLQNMVTETAELSDLLDLEREIADTQYQIDSLQGSLNRTDQQVAYSTIDISLDEEKVQEKVQDPELTLFQRIQAAFSLGIESAGEFLTDMLLFLVATLPFLLTAALVILLAVLLIRRRNRNRKKDKTDSGSAGSQDA